MLAQLDPLAPHRHVSGCLPRAPGAGGRWWGGGALRPPLPSESIKSTSRHHPRAPLSEATQAPLPYAATPLPPKRRSGLSDSPGLGAAMQATPPPPPLGPVSAPSFMRGAAPRTARVF